MSLIRRASARRKFHLALALLWIGPGGLLCILFPNAIWWVVFMSWFANVYTCISALSAETPVESEGGGA